MPWGSGPLRLQPVWAVKGAGSRLLRGPGRSAPGAPCQCLRTSSFFSGDLWGPVCGSPFLSLSLLPCFSAAKLGPLALSSSAWGRGRVPAAPCLGPPAWEQWTPSAFHRALFPTWFSQGQIGSALAWNNLQDAGGGGTSLPTSSLGTGIAPLPPSLPRSCGQEGRSVTTCEGNRGLFFRAQGLASLGSAADGCSPHHPSPYPQHSP